MTSATKARFKNDQFRPNWCTGKVTVCSDKDLPFRLATTSPSGPASGHGSTMPWRKSASSQYSQPYETEYSSFAVSSGTCVNYHDYSAEDLHSIHQSVTRWWRSVRWSPHCAYRLDRPILNTNKKQVAGPVNRFERKEREHLPCAGTTFLSRKPYATFVNNGETWGAAMRSGSRTPVRPSVSRR